MSRWLAFALLTVPIIAIACGGGSGGELSPDEDDSSELPGDYVDIPELYGDDDTRHVQEDVEYATDQGLPPAGGPHWGSTACPTDPAEAPDFCGPVPWGVYREPWPEESLMHNIEHGGVIIWYDTSEQAVIDELEQYAAQQLQDQRFLVLTPYPELDEEVALTSWTRRDRFAVADYSIDRVREFVDAHERRYNPEGF